jgi:DNA-directed RNA polymerase sigma subunit (sigma70/sigma32)
MGARRDWVRHACILLMRRAGKTLKEAGAALGVSKERARQMEAAAVHELIYGRQLRELAPPTDQELRLSRAVAS